MVDALFHPEAQDEYEVGLAWYRKRSESAAQRFEAEVGSVLELIQNRPMMFPKYDDDHRYALLRRFPYAVIYQIFQSRLFIVAVAHASRKPDYWQGRSIDDLSE